MDKERKTKKEKRLVQRVKSYMERKYKWVLEATKEEVFSNMITIPMKAGDLLFFRSDLFHYGPKKKENDRYVLIHLCIYLYISIYFIINICIYIYIYRLSYLCMISKKEHEHKPKDEFCGTLQWFNTLCPKYNLKEKWVDEELDEEEFVNNF